MAMHMQMLQRKKAAALEARLKNPDDPLTKNLRAAGPEHLREGAPRRRSQHLRRRCKIRGKVVLPTIGIMVTGTMTLKRTTRPDDHDALVQ